MPGRRTGTLSGILGCLCGHVAPMLNIRTLCFKILLGDTALFICEPRKRLSYLLRFQPGWRARRLESDGWIGGWTQLRKATGESMSATRIEDSEGQSQSPKSPTPAARWIYDSEDRRIFSMLIAQLGHEGGTGTAKLRNCPSGPASHAKYP